MQRFSRLPDMRNGTVLNITLSLYILLPFYRCLVRNFQFARFTHCYSRHVRHRLSGSLCSNRVLILITSASYREGMLTSRRAAFLCLKGGGSYPRRWASIYPRNVRQYKTWISILVSGKRAKEYNVKRRRQSIIYVVTARKAQYFELAKKNIFQMLMFSDTIICLVIDKETHEYTRTYLYMYRRNYFSNKKHAI